MLLTDRFSLSNFWGDIREHSITAFYYIGEILNLLTKTDPGELGRETSLRIGFGIGGAPTDVTTFQYRHGVMLGTCYGSTEGNVPVFSDPGVEPGSTSAGRVLPEFMIKVVDAEGRDLPTDEVGEIIIHSREPASMLRGYDGDPDATRLALRDGWFYSGDAGRLDAQGNLHFVSRIKDVIRVRGENVSAFEVEATLLSFPGVVEAAAIAVPGELGGDDVKAVIVADPTIDLAALCAHCEQRLPRFSVPRYFEVRSNLPKTPTNKIQKNVLREDGLNSATWDQKAASYLTEVSPSDGEKIRK